MTNKKEKAQITFTESEYDDCNDYTCGRCDKIFTAYPGDFNSQDNLPKFCPFCGIEFNHTHNAEMLGSLIKNEYHKEDDSDEEKMEKWLDELIALARMGEKE
jgi:hypothetical protein